MTRCRIIISNGCLKFKCYMMMALLPNEKKTKPAPWQLEKNDELRK
jgi:hypothetical protein